MWVVMIAGIVALALMVHWRRSGVIWQEYLGLGLVYLYARLWHRWSSNGPSPIPARGPAILIANHTCSADAAFLTAGCARPLSFLIAREYYDLPVVPRLFAYMGCVPVERNGHDATAVRVGLRRLAEGRILCIYPEGGLSNAGRSRLRRGKAGAALFALRSGVPIVPARIMGGPQTNRIALSWLRPSQVRVVFGPPVDLSVYLGQRINRRLLEAVTRRLMEHIAALK
jgi:1-acyl-sn-glycerol-3-phosphate acyltransferase